MNFRKLTGYLFLTISIILALALIGQIQKFLGVIISVFSIFSGDLSASEAGSKFGHFAYWAVHISAMIFLFRKGQKWRKGEAQLNTPGSISSD